MKPGEGQSAVIEFSWWKAFTCRLRHSMLILAVVSYLRVTFNNVQALYCVHVPDPLSTTGSNLFLLQVDLLTTCYEGYHRYSVIFIWPCMIFI